MKSFKEFILEQSDPKEQFQKAYNLAKKAHSSQKDFAGVPYINHIDAVIKNVSRHGDIIKTIAALHDVVEDTNVTLDFLKKEGFSDEVIKAVDAITKRKGEQREAYYSRVKRNSFARIVKLADIKTNADEQRLKKLPVELADRLRQKYKKARNLVESAYLDKDEILSFKVTIIERAKSSLTQQPWSSLSTTKEKGKELEKIYKQILDFVLKVKNEFVRLLHRSANKKEDKVLFNIKKFDSFINKTVERGKDIKHMTDVIRGAILCSSKEDVERVVKNIKRFGRIHTHEYKELSSGDKYGYHGSHHIDVQVGNVIAEIQIMTKRLWTYKSAAHDIYDELRSQTDRKISDSEIQKKLSRSRELFRIGNR